MSSGHHQGGRASDAELDRILDETRIKTRLDQTFQYNFDYDVPYLCGYSTDAKTVYVDRHMPKIVQIQGRPTAVLRFLNLHERLEKALIDLQDYAYSGAHELATAYEHRAVVKAGISPTLYEKALAPFIKGAEHEKIKRVPKDLDLTPYKGSERLLEHMKSCMV